MVQRLVQEYREQIAGEDIAELVDIYRKRDQSGCHGMKFT